MINHLTAAKYWLFLLDLAIKRSLFLDRPEKASCAKALIITPGGVATTTILMHLNQFVPANDPNDRDWLKHMPYPPQCAPDVKIVYIYDKPKAVYASLKRRGIHRIQAAKLGCVACRFVWGSLHEDLTCRAIERQKARFEAENNVNVLLVEYGAIWDNIAEMAMHLGVDDPMFVEDFPSRKERSTDSHVNSKHV